jgi:dTDP-4-amino-4,6-dideoxygalactose transaminase
MINLPDFDRFARIASRAFHSRRVTNNGTLVKDLEERLAAYLGVPHLVLTSSGTLALQIAYKALELTGEVITTPFTWVTTASSLRWIGLRPVFADVDPQTFNLDPAQIEKRITSRTSAILAVHTFGNPANIAAIQAVAARHNLRVIYDGAHAFGVRYRGASVLMNGDASTLSFHATKLFHTVEGGAVICRDRDAAERARAAVNNGMNESQEIETVGTNGRMSELHAAVGLALLPSIDAVLDQRRRIATHLRARLSRLGAVRLQCLNPDAVVNYSYSPVVFPSAERRRSVQESLVAAGFAPRRYFAPTLNRLPVMGDSTPMPVAEELSERVLCLPIDAETSFEDVERMVQIVSPECSLLELREPAGVSA